MEILYEAPLPHSGFSAQPDPSRAKPRPLSEAEDEEEDAGEAAADQEGTFAYLPLSPLITSNY